MSRPDYLTMETSPHLQGAYDVDMEKAWHTFSEADNAEKQPLLYPTAPAPIVDRNDDLPDAPSRPPRSWKAAEGAVLDEYCYPDLFVLRKLEAASPTTSGIYNYRVALSAALLIKNVGWIPDSISVPMHDMYGDMMPALWVVLYLFYSFVPGSLEFEPGSAVLFYPTQTLHFSRIISYIVIFLLSGFSFNDLPFPSFGPKFFRLLFQTMAELSLLQGWEICPEYFEALSWSVYYLFLLLVLDDMLPTLCTFLGRFRATGPNPDALPRFYVTVGTMMYVLMYLMFVWSWNTQLGYQ